MTDDDWVEAEKRRRFAEAEYARELEQREEDAQLSMDHAERSAWNAMKARAEHAEAALAKGAARAGVSAAPPGHVRLSVDAIYGVMSILIPRGEAKTLHEALGRLLEEMENG